MGSVECGSMVTLGRTTNGEIWWSAGWPSMLICFTVSCTQIQWVLGLCSSRVPCEERPTQQTLSMRSSVGAITDTFVEIQGTIFSPMDTIIFQCQSGLTVVCQLQQNQCTLQ